MEISNVPEKVREEEKEIQEWDEYIPIGGKSRQFVTENF
jgi:hypothetical protein